MQKFNLLSLLVVLGCLSPKPNKTDVISDFKQELNSSFTPIWTCKFDSISGGFTISKVREVSIDSLSPNGLTSIINNTFVHYFINFTKTSRDTIYMLFPASDILKEKFGENLLNYFLITSTFTLTELERIKYVSIEFDSYKAPTYFKVFGRSSWSK